MRSAPCSAPTSLALRRNACRGPRVRRMCAPSRAPGSRGGCAPPRPRLSGCPSASTNTCSHIFDGYPLATVSGSPRPGVGGRRPGRGRGPAGTPGHASGDVRRQQLGGHGRHRRRAHGRQYVPGRCRGGDLSGMSRGQGSAHGRDPAGSRAARLLPRDQAGRRRGQRPVHGRMFTSHDGRFVYVSRPSFADVVGISLRTGEIVWGFPMEGQRSDHMAISPDGTTLLVSDSTANKVHRLDAATGRKTGEFPSGDSPHENNYSKDGRLVYHASIGRVYTPTDQELIGPLELIRDTTKGERYFQIVDASTMQVLERFNMGDKLAEAGHPEMESAVRPMA